jgi:hypothetical protein
MKDFILYPEAFELKELGFDEPCLAWFSDRNIRIVGTNGCVVSSLPVNSNFKDDDEFVSAPTYSQAFRWFREKGIANEIHSDFDRMLGHNRGYIPVVQFIEFYNNGDCYETYEEAELECLKKLIEILKK